MDSKESLSAVYGALWVVWNMVVGKGLDSEVVAAVHMQEPFVKSSSEMGTRSTAAASEGMVFQEAVAQMDSPETFQDQT